MQKRISIIVGLSLLLSILSSASAQMPPGMPGMMPQQDAELDLKERDVPAVVTLDNGMQFLLIENHASPMIASVVVVKTGARNESIELGGATHFLEHLLFNGTETRTQEKLYDEMDFIGGYNNANTAHDRTTFMILTEKSNFARGLEIQADMLFHSILPEDKFEKEKGIVIEEIGKDEDSETYRVSKFFDEVMYKDTPYQWPILGSRQSIGNLTRESVWNYYKAYYVPNNMIGAIIGDFSTVEMIELLQEIFGKEPPRTCPPPERIILTSFRPDPQTGKTFYHNQGEGTAHRARYSLWAPTREYPDYHAFVILQQMLQDYLDQELTTADLGITGVSLHHFVDVDFAFLNIDLTIEPGRSCEYALKELEALVELFREQEFQLEEIHAVVTSIRSEDAFNAERPHFFGMLKSEDLAQGGPYFLLEYQDRLNHVTVADVQQAAVTFLNTEHPIIAVYEAVKEKALEGEMQVSHKMVRKEMPNGAIAIVQENMDNPIFAAHFLFKHRSAWEMQLGKPGMVDFLHHMLDYGPAEMTKEDFQAELQKYGARTKFYDMSFIPYDDYYTTPEFSYVRLEVMEENHLPALNLVAQALMNPSYGPDVVEPVRGQMTGQARMNMGSVSKRGTGLFKELIFGDSPLAAEVVGDMEDISSYTALELQEFGHKYFSPGNLILTVVTSTDAEIVMGEIEQLIGNWESEETMIETTVPKPDGEAKRQEETGGKEQSSLSMGYVFDLQEPSDRAPLILMNSILSKRMQFQLREREGLAYTLGSSVSFYGNWGVWSARMGTGPANLERAEVGILEEVRKATTEEYSDQDVEKARNSYLQRMAMRRLTRINNAYLLGLYELRGEGSDHLDGWLDELRAVTTEDVMRVARQYLRSDNMTVAIVR